MILCLVLFLLVVVGVGAFIYKAKYGFNSYETKHHVLDKRLGDKSILVLSKTNGFRHGQAIEASLPVLKSIVARNEWNVYMTEDAGIFNKEQLGLFDIVIFNNCTGKVLNPDQRKLFKSYILKGGGFLGIHGAGDDSHQWPWYTDTLIGARFSHHPIEFQIQEAVLNKEVHPDSSHNFNSKLPASFRASDEWYVFYESPRTIGKQILYTLDEAELSWNGSIGPFAKDKIYGMGEDHPIVWYQNIGVGRSFYTAMGHHGDAWNSIDHHAILEEGIRWAAGFD